MQPVIADPLQSGPTVPDWLLPYTVEQDTSRYTAIDQAVWRFVLLQMYDRLKQTAHPAYADGLANSGISCDRIPSVAEMNRCLNRVGLGAVCVDGFIPPRVFQAFQANGILPIAAEIRSPDHLPYTPAPDIIHEAAGHAPILHDELYARYIRSSGEIASRAFTIPADTAVYSAIYALSAMKEDPSAAASELERAERALERALDSVQEVSEATAMSRLYWWTAEYGLVGSARDYKLYGAGLLSSLWESYSCHSPKGTKIPLSRDCIDVDYYITRSQPLLFVARDFEHLLEVLHEVSEGLAFTRGGAVALSAARKSQEPCTVCFDQRMDVVGTLTDVTEHDSRVLALTWSGGAAIVDLAGEMPRTSSVQGPFVVPVGPLRSGASARRVRETMQRGADDQGRVEIEYLGGLTVTGAPVALARSGFLGDVEHVVYLQDCQIRHGDVVLVDSREPYPLLLTDGARTAYAGSDHPQHAESAMPSSAREPGLMPSTGRGGRPIVPKRRTLSARMSRLDGLYAQAAGLRSQVTAGRVAPDIAERARVIYDSLTGDLSDEWLLRWNLLELVRVARQTGDLTEVLRADLVRLEDHYEGRHPIRMGLRFLGLHD